MRYIIIEKTLGVFVGQFDVYAIYAKNEVFGAHKVVSFDTRKSAVKYVENSLNSKEKEFTVERIETNAKYVLVEDIIRAGLGEHTHRMMDNIFMPSEAIH